MGSSVHYFFGRRRRAEDRLQMARDGERVVAFSILRVNDMMGELRVVIADDVVGVGERKMEVLGRREQSGPKFSAVPR